MKYFIILSVVLHNQVYSQYLRPPYNILNRPENQATPNLKPAPAPLPPLVPLPPPPPPPIIAEPPCNPVVPIPAPPQTTLITDCSPSICQNLANTIQLMIVCNLLQNSKSTDMALQLAGPILNEVMTSPALSCGCPNPIPNLANLGTISPNLGTILNNNLIPNVIAPNAIAVNSPSLGPLATPNFTPVYPGPYAPNLGPRVVSPTPCANKVLSSVVNTVAPNAPLSAANANGLLNTIMSMLGKMQ